MDVPAIFLDDLSWERLHERRPSHISAVLSETAARTGQKKCSEHLASQNILGRISSWRTGSTRSRYRRKSTMMILHDMPCRVILYHAILHCVVLTQVRITQITSYAGTDIDSSSIDHDLLTLMTLILIQILILILMPALYYSTLEWHILHTICYVLHTHTLYDTVSMIVYIVYYVVFVLWCIVYAR